MPHDLQRLYLSLPIATCAITRSLHFIAANHRYAELMRAPLESIVGRSMEGLNPQEHIDNVRRDFATLDRGGTVPDHEITLWAGTYLVSVGPLRDSAGDRAHGISVTLVNVTRQKHLTQELAVRIDRLAQDKAEVSRLAHTDALTGLGNRRAFDAAMARELPVPPAPAGEPLSLLLIDVDCFKAYNDLYGHLAGDECLRQVAQALRDGLSRPDDVPIRFGGEEFIVVLPRTALDDAATVAHTLRRRVADLRIGHAGSPHKVVTVSVGIACHGPSADADLRGSTRRLLEAADAALYAAKRQGRNRVSLQP